jgi:hypothetical protein
MTQAEVEAAHGPSSKTLSSIESGKMERISERTLNQLTAIPGVTVERLEQVLRGEAPESHTNGTRPEDGRLTRLEAAVFRLEASAAQRDRQLEDLRTLVEQLLSGGRRARR